MCSFCTSNYHFSCLPRFCPCLVDPLSKTEGIIWNNVPQIVEGLNLQMPDDFIGEKWENLDQIKFLLAGRRFYYTSTAKLLSGSYLLGAKDSIKKFKVRSINLPKYQEY